MKPTDLDLYNQVKDIIIEINPKHSAYRSMLIQKKYKEVFEDLYPNKQPYLNKKPKKDKLNRWLDEQWINVYAYLNENKIIPCGSSEYVEFSACRPLIRVNKKTPITIKELLDKFGKDKLNELIKIKNKDPQNLILRWKDGKIIKKKL
jgi:hypothetical protein